MNNLIAEKKIVSLDFTIFHDFLSKKNEHMKNRRPQRFDLLRLAIKKPWKCENIDVNKLITINDSSIDEAYRNVNIYKRIMEDNEVIQSNINIDRCIKEFEELRLEWVRLLYELNKDYIEIRRLLMTIPNKNPTYASELTGNKYEKEFMEFELDELMSAYEGKINTN